MNSYSTSWWSLLLIYHEDERLEYKYITVEYEYIDYKYEYVTLEYEYINQVRT